MDEIKEIVTHTLDRQGVLASMKAQLRAYVFAAIEEGGKGSDGKGLSQQTRNSQRDKLLGTEDGTLLACLVREFLAWSNLAFTMKVYDPELDLSEKPRSHEQLCTQLGLIESEDAPLLLTVLRSFLAGKSHTGPASAPRPASAPPTAPSQPAQLQIQHTIPTGLGAGTGAGLKPTADLHTPPPVAAQAQGASFGKPASTQAALPIGPGRTAVEEVEAATTPPPLSFSNPKFRFTATAMQEITGASPPASREPQDTARPLAAAAVPAAVPGTAATAGTGIAATAATSPPALVTRSYLTDIPAISPMPAAAPGATGKPGGQEISGGQVPAVLAPQTKTALGLKQTGELLSPGTSPSHTQVSDHSTSYDLSSSSSRLTPTGGGLGSAEVSSRPPPSAASSLLNPMAAAARQPSKLAPLQPLGGAGRGPATAPVPGLRGLTAPPLEGAPPRKTADDIKAELKQQGLLRDPPAATAAVPRSDTPMVRSPGSSPDQSPQQSPQQHHGSGSPEDQSPPASAAWRFQSRRENLSGEPSDQSSVGFPRESFELVGQESPFDGSEQGSDDDHGFELPSGSDPRRAAAHPSGRVGGGAKSGTGAKSAAQSERDDNEDDEDAELSVSDYSGELDDYDVDYIEPARERWP